MGQPRLITAQLNRIQCGRQGWLQGPASSCVIPAEREREREMRGRSVFVEKSALMGEKVEKDEREISEHLIAKPAPPIADWRHYY